MPYQMKAKTDGLHVCYPKKIVEEKFIITAFVDNLILGSTAGLGQHKVVRYDDLSVTTRYVMPEKNGKIFYYCAFQVELGFKLGRGTSSQRNGLCDNEIQ